MPTAPPVASGGTTGSSGITSACGARASLSWRHRRLSTRMRIVARRTVPTPVNGEWLIFLVLCVSCRLSTPRLLDFFTLRDSAVRSRAPPRCRTMFTVREISDVVFFLCFFFTWVVPTVLLDVRYILMNEHQQILWRNVRCPTVNKQTHPVLSP